VEFQYYRNAQGLPKNLQEYEEIINLVKAITPFRKKYLKLNWKEIDQAQIKVNCCADEAFVQYMGYKGSEQEVQLFTNYIKLFLKYPGLLHVR